MPPAHLRAYVGDRRYFALVGSSNLALYRRMGLTDNDDVLDIGCGCGCGCGCGRLARPLTRFLAPDARYEGFDVSAEAIDWCKDNIAARHPNFGFTH